MGRKQVAGKIKKRKETAEYMARKLVNAENDLASIRMALDECRKIIMDEIKATKTSGPFQERRLALAKKMGW